MYRTKIMPIFCENTTTVAINEEEITAITQFTLQYLNISASVEVTLTFISDEEIAQLHEQWLDLPGATDVMSFPIDEIKPGYSPGNVHSFPVMGDIVIAPHFAARQAQEANRTFEQELQILTVHGLLHLAGYDHYSPQEHEEMFGIQEAIINQYNHSIEST